MAAMGNLLSKDLGLQMYEDLKIAVPWLVQYLKPTEDTVRKMTESMNKLRSRMQPVARKLLEICENGWSPRESTIEWIHKGLDYSTRVQVIVDRYIQLRDRHTGSNGSAAEAMLHCPCDAVLTSRQINMDALGVIVDVIRHYTDGETYEKEAYHTVAILAGANYPDVLQDLYNLIPKVKQSATPSDCSASVPVPVPVPVRERENISFTMHQSTVKTVKTNMSVQRWSSLAIQPSTPATQEKVVVKTPAVADIGCNYKGENFTFLGGRGLNTYKTLEKLELSAFSRYRALSRCEEEDSTPVMIRVKAPRYGYGCRSPIDLVMVLDITRSMACGEKLSQIKQGALFVLRNLQAEDRLSIMGFDNNCTHLLFPLTFLSDEGTIARARTTIAELPSGATPSNIILAPAMEAVHQILAQRAEHGDHLARVMVLTDCLEGKAAITTQGDYPTYTFGLGPEHDRWKAYGVASQGHGTYSFDSTTDLKGIGAAMALCIGGLTSIAAQRVEISIRSEQPAGVRISRITSGAYHNHVKESGTLGSIIVDDMYSSEEKNFLVYVNVPRDDAAGGFFQWTTKTKLLTVEAKYYCPVTNTSVSLDPVEVSVERKRQTQASSQAVGVAGEVIRARVFEEVAKIAADNVSNQVGRTDSNFSLAAVRSTIEDTPEARAAKDTWEGLSRDLDSMEEFETGLPFMLSWLTSHQWQRAAMPGSMSKSVLINFRTTRMNNLIDSVVDLAPVDMRAAGTTLLLQWPADFFWCRGK